MPDKDNLHKDHRKRMMNKYIENGINSFEKHEILEMLLFNVFTRCNTNNISHMLLNEFRSIKEVLNASIDSLTTIDGIGENAAARIHFFGDLYRYLSLEFSAPLVLNSTKRVVEICRDIVDISTTEFFLLFFMDNKQTLVTKYFVKCNYNKVVLDRRSIAAKAVYPGCTCAIAVHNHLNEFVRPSSTDISSTFELRSFLENLKVDLLDHLILSSNSYFSMRSSHVCRSIWL